MPSEGLPATWHEATSAAGAGYPPLAGAIAGRDDRVRLFSPCGQIWSGGPLGRAGVQLTYWSMQALDALEERAALRGVLAAERR